MKYSFDNNLKKGHAVSLNCLALFQFCSQSILLRVTKIKHKKSTTNKYWRRHL